jgi:hypothetical protein
LNERFHLFLWHYSYSSYFSYYYSYSYSYYPLQMEEEDDALLPACFVFERRERRLNRVEVWFRKVILTMRVKLSLHQGKHWNTTSLAETLQQFLVQEANLRSEDQRLAQEEVEKLRRQQGQEDRLEAQIKAGQSKADHHVSHTGHTSQLLLQTSGQSLGAITEESGLKKQKQQQQQQQQTSKKKADGTNGTGGTEGEGNTEGSDSAQRHRPRVLVMVAGEREFRSKERKREEREWSYRICMSDWLALRALMAQALLSSGRLDQAREECDHGLLEAKTSNERISRLTLGCLRAQIHTAEGEDVEAVKVLDETMRLNFMGGGQGASTEDPSLDQDRKWKEEDDSMCLHPSKLCECLMLKGDLLIEISQAESKASRIHLQAQALLCFTRAQALAQHSLHLSGWEDQAKPKATSPATTSGTAPTSPATTTPSNRPMQGGYLRYAEGALSNVWYREVTLLSKACMRVGRISATLSTAEDGDMSLEESCVSLSAMTLSLTALHTGHLIGPPPTLLPTVMLFHGRLQRLVLHRRDPQQLSLRMDASMDTNMDANPNTDSTDALRWCRERTGNVYVDTCLNTLMEGISLSILCGGHDHLLLRASLLELCSIYGSQVCCMPTTTTSTTASEEMREDHKRKASFYLRKAALATSMYQILRSEVGDIASGEVLTQDEVNSLPPDVLSHLVHMQLEVDEEVKADQECQDQNTTTTTTTTNLEGEGENNVRSNSGFTEEGKPVLYVSPLAKEKEVFASKVEQCVLSMRTVMYYYLECLQQRRICSAASNNDGRSVTIVTLHNWLCENCPTYKSRCCFTSAKQILYRSSSSRMKEEEEDGENNEEEPLSPDG